MRYLALLLLLAQAAPPIVAAVCVAPAAVLTAEVQEAHMPGHGPLPAPSNGGDSCDDCETASCPSAMTCATTAQVPAATLAMAMKAPSLQGPADVIAGAPPAAPAAALFHPPRV